MENKKTKLGLRLFIDDIREAPEGWTLVTTVSQAISTINFHRHRIKEISFDHDISYPVVVNGVSKPYPSPENFQAVALFIKEIWGDYPGSAPKMTVHSANPVGAHEIAQILLDFDFDVSIVPYKPATRRAL